MRKRLICCFVCVALFVISVPTMAYAELENESITGVLGDYYTYSLDLQKKELTLGCCDNSAVNTPPSSALGNVQNDLSESPIINERIKKIILEENFAPVDNNDWGLWYFFNWLEEIEVHENNTFYTSNDGVLFNKDKTILYYYPMHKGGEEYVIPEGVQSIGSDLVNVCPFENVSYLKKIKIPQSILEIFEHSFVNAQMGDGNSIEAFVIEEENGFYKTEDGVLFSKDGKKLVTYPSSKTNMFYEVPDSVKTIGNNAFMTARNLKEISIPEGVETIGNYSFYVMWGYSGNFEIPASVKSIGQSAFGWLGSSPMSSTTVSFARGTQLKEFPDNAFPNCGQIPVYIPCGLDWDLSDVKEKFDFQKTHQFTNYTYNNDAAVGKDGTETAVCDYGCGTKDTRTKAGTALSGGGSSGGGIYIPPVQKPEISSGDGYTTELSDDGKTAEIMIDEDYELVDVSVNGISKGSVTTLEGLKTGDKVVITVISKVEKIQNQLKTVNKENLQAHSKQVKLKNGKKAVKLTWKNTSGIDFDGVEIFRSFKRYEGFGTKPIFTTEKEQYYNSAIKKGKRYYYKVRGYVEYDGVKYYSGWSAKAWRTVK